MDEKIIMRRSIKKAIGETLQGLVDIGIKTSFTEEELRKFNVIIPKVKINAKNVQALGRKKVNNEIQTR